jgi:translation initiation factor IF-2
MTWHGMAGTALICEVSARDGDGIENLVEGILLQADVMELKAARAGQAEVMRLDEI